MTIGELKQLLHIFSLDNDAIVKVSTVDGFQNVIEIEFANDINTLIIHIGEG